MFTNPDYDTHEHVVFHRDPSSGLTAIIALHSTALGPAFGGCRMWPYDDEDRALTDALRLSRGMTYKAAICDLPYGGGKSVIIGDPATAKTPNLLRAMGRLVDTLGGRYIIADDVGIGLADLAEIRTETQHTAAATPAAQQPLAVTAHGVFQALRAAVSVQLGTRDLGNLSVAIQGLGAVGMPLSAALSERGARLVVTDTDPAKIDHAQRNFGATGVETSAIYDAETDIFAPCALGAVLNDDTIPRLNTRIICGGANNQLAAPRHDRALAERDITFVPDYLANAGGVIDFHQEAIDDSPAAILAAVDRIGTITDRVLTHARSAGKTPLTIANSWVQERLERAKNEQ